MRVAISVEGQTEEEFVKKVLAPHLREKGVEPTPIVIGVGRRGSRGGNVSMPRLAGDMVSLFHKYDAVSSLVDFYGFRGKGDMSIDALEQQLADEIKDKLGGRWRSDRVLAYVQRHEFEGLLFSNVDAFSDSINATERAVQELRSIRAGFATPEDINDDQETVPSKRIVTALHRYHKVQDGLLIAQTMGMDVIVAECPRFAAWVKKLEALGQQS